MRTWRNCPGGGGASKDYVRSRTSRVRTLKSLYGRGPLKDPGSSQGF